MEDILKIINILDLNKAHGQVKNNGSSVGRPLEIIYKSCLDRGKFPQEWKETNYRPTSLLAVRGKSFECMLYNSMFNFLN